MIARVLENIQNQAYLLTAHLGERVDSHMPIFRFLRDLKESISEYRDANPDSIT